MQKVIKKFESFKDAEEAEIKFWASLSHEERMKIFFQIIAPKDPNNATIQRCVRVLKLSELKED